MAACPAAPTAQAAGARPVGASAAVGASPVGASEAVPRAARIAAPTAAVAPGRGVVTTGARKSSDSRWLITGIAAPPPTVATAARRDAGIRLRSRASPSASRKPVNGSAIRPSNSVRVSLTSARYPGRSTGTTVAMSEDSRSLARRHSARNLVSPPTAAVPDGSRWPAARAPARTWLSSTWSMRSPEKSPYRTVSPIGARAAPASPSEIELPLPPKSHSATTPLVGSPGSACRAVSAAAASETIVGGRPAGANAGAPRSAPRSAPTVAGPQCAGTATVTVAGARPSSTVRAIASSATATRLSPRCADPSAATSGTGSPTRSTKPRSTRPASPRFGLVSSGFWEGTPTSAGRPSQSVNTARRLTAAPSGRAATRFVVPIASPSASLMWPP